MVPTKTFLSPPPILLLSQQQKIPLTQDDLVHSRLGGDYSPFQSNDSTEKKKLFQPTFVMFSGKPITQKQQQQQQQTPSTAAPTTTTVTEPVTETVSQTISAPVTTVDAISKVEPSFHIDRLIEQTPTLGEGLTSGDKAPILEPTVDVVAPPASTTAVQADNKKNGDPFEIFQERKTQRRVEVPPEISWPSKYFVAERVTKNNAVETGTNATEWKPTLNFSD